MLMIKNHPGMRGLGESPEGAYCMAATRTQADEASCEGMWRAMGEGVARANYPMGLAPGGGGAMPQQSSGGFNPMSLFMPTATPGLMPGMPGYIPPQPWYSNPMTLLLIAGAVIIGVKLLAPKAA